MDEAIAEAPAHGIDESVAVWGYSAEVGSKDGKSEDVSPSPPDDVRVYH